MFSHPLLIDSHPALFLLRNCFSIPKLYTYYVLRLIISHPMNWAKLTAYFVSHVHFDNTGWRIATLPIRFGGLGLRSVSDISEVAYLASMHATEGLVKNILSSFIESFFDNSLAVRVQSWNKRNFVLPETKSSQLQWDQINCKIVSENLKTSLDQHRLASFLAAF